MKFPSLIFSALALGMILLPTLAHAQMDQRCWTKQDCMDARKKNAEPFVMTEAEAADGFYTGMDAVGICGTQVKADGTTEEQLGFCLPSYKTKTQISFGGRTDFLHIGDFIQFIYRYGIWVVGLVAVLVIVFAGFERLTSGGNPDRIQSSNKRIAGALIGVLLAAGSFVILRTISPALVNLRLPQVWMVNPIRLASPYCTSMPDNTYLAPLGPSGQQYSETQKKQAFEQAQQNKSFQIISTALPKCGTDYLIQSGGNQSCSGTICNPNGGQVCFQGTKDTKPSCKNGMIAGKIYSSSFSDQIAESSKIIKVFAAATVGEGWKWDWVTNVWLTGVCQDGFIVKTMTEGNITKADEDKYILEYTIPGTPQTHINSLGQTCSNHGGTKGFALELNMNEFDAIGIDPDENHIVGKYGNNPIDIGDVPEDSVLGIPLPHSDYSYAETNTAKLNSNYFISEKELKEGLQLDIDVTKVCDIDEPDTERPKCYKF